MKILFAFILYGLFFAVCYAGTGTTKKNIKSFYSYSDEIQEQIRNNDSLNSMIPKAPKYVYTFLANTILFSLIFAVIGFILNLNVFSEALIYFLLLGQGLNLFDLIVIDLIWWRNTKRVRFEELSAESQMYRNPQKHIMAFLRGIPMFMCAALLSSAIVVFV